MADSEISGLTESTAPATTVAVYGQNAAGDTDYRIPIGALRPTTVVYHTGNNATSGTALSTAVAAASAGNIIELEAGKTYTMSATLTFAAGVGFIGNHAQIRTAYSVIFTDVDETTVLESINVHGANSSTAPLVIGNGTLGANVEIGHINVSNAGPGGIGVTLRNLQNSHIRSITSTNHDGGATPADWAVSIDEGSRNIVIDWLHASTANQNLLITTNDPNLLDTRTNKIWIQSGLFEGTSSTTEPMIELGDCEDVRFDNCILNGTTAAYGYGAVASGSKGGGAADYPRKVTIDGGKISGPTYCFYLAGVPSADGGWSIGGMVLGADTSVYNLASSSCRVTVHRPNWTDAETFTLSGGATQAACWKKVAISADLTAIAALTSAADKVPYATGSGTWALADFPSAARTFFTTPSSANLAALLSDETGTGANVHASAPTLSNPVVGTQTAADNSTKAASTAYADALVSDTAYDATSWNAVTGIAPSKNAVRDKFEALPAVVAGDRWAPDIITTPGSLIGNVTLSGGIAGGDTLAGGNAASETLTLKSTAHATKGTINLEDRVLLVSADATFSADTTSVNFIDVPSTRTFTFSSATTAGKAFKAVSFAPTITMAGNSATYYSFLFQNAAKIKNDSGNARTLGTAYTLSASPNLQADAATVTASGITGVFMSPVFDVVNAGVLNVAAVVGVGTGATVNTGATVTALAHLSIGDVTGTGAVTTQYGVDIPVLTFATTNIGLRNASTTCYSRQTPTISAASTQIVPTATFVTLNTSTSYTLTATPTIAAGQNGQFLIICGRHASGVQTFQDSGTLASSGLRLGAATRAVGPGDTLTLVYENGLAAWVEVGFVASVS